LPKKINDLTDNHPFLPDVIMHNPHFEEEGGRWWLAYHKMFNSTHFDSGHIHRTCCYISEDGLYRCSYHFQGSKEHDLKYFDSSVKLLEISIFSTCLLLSTNISSNNEMINIDNTILNENGLIIE
jgi:hypothetical protein